MELDASKERFAALYQSSRSKLLAYALRRTTTPEDAADVVAETFIVAWKRLDLIPSGDASMPWLYATARRVIANHHRKAHRGDQLVERLGNNLAAGISAQLDPSEQDAMEAAVALTRLSEDDRELLMLAGWEGLNTAQLAYVLDCSPIAARVRLHHARSRLNAELAELDVWTKQKQTGPSRHLPRRRAVPADAPEEAETR